MRHIFSFIFLQCKSCVARTLSKLLFIVHIFCQRIQFIICDPVLYEHKNYHSMLNDFGRTFRNYFFYNNRNLCTQHWILCKTLENIVNDYEFFFLQCFFCFLLFTSWFSLWLSTQLYPTIYFTFSPKSIISIPSELFFSFFLKKWIICRTEIEW